MHLHLSEQALKSVRLSFWFIGSIIFAILTAKEANLYNKDPKWKNPWNKVGSIGKWSGRRESVLNGIAFSLWHSDPWMKTKPSYMKKLVLVARPIITFGARFLANKSLVIHNLLWYDAALTWVHILSSNAWLGWGTKRVQFCLEEDDFWWSNAWRFF